MVVQRCGELALETGGEAGDTSDDAFSAQANAGAVPPLIGIPASRPCAGTAIDGGRTDLLPSSNGICANAASAARSFCLAATHAMLCSGCRSLASWRSSLVGLEVARSARGPATAR